MIFTNWPWWYIDPVEPTMCRNNTEELYDVWVIIEELPYLQFVINHLFYSLGNSRGQL